MNRQNKQVRTFFHFFFVSLIIVLVAAGLTTALVPPVPNIPQIVKNNDKQIATKDGLLKDYIKAYGADKTIAYLKTLPVDCHNRVHKVGRLSYQLYGNKAFTLLNSECMSGYTHGVTEAYFHEHGTENLNQSLELICQGQEKGFYAHQCFHGVGHGLMAYNDYDLPAALKECDSLPPIGTSLESCYSGVFMENVVGAISVDEAKNSSKPGDFHSSSWLNDDPLFPCDAVEIKYKNTCYFFQSSRMIEVYGIDYQKVAGACASIEAVYRWTCFSSMGRDVSNTYKKNYSQIAISCDYPPDEQSRLSCISGAAQDKFWHESQQDDALGMCKALTWTAAKENCYSTVSGRGSEIIPTKERGKLFCSKFEPEYARLCALKQ